MAMSRKTGAEELLKEISDDFITYLKQGQLNIDSFIKEPNLNINDLDHLLDVHFILQDEVVDFIADLPNNLRRIKTAIHKLKRLTRGEIRGKIDWNSTIKARCKINYRDKTIYSCQETNKNFNIKENLVLKELLDTIYRVLFIRLDIEQIDGYKWFDKWVGGQKLAHQFRSIYRRNIYLNQIDGDQIKVTDRMIHDTKRNRSSFYRTAAHLLEKFRRIKNFELDQEEIKELLRLTFIRPDKEETLFELFWAIRLIRRFTDNAQFNIIDGRTSQMADWEDDDYRYSLYHDREGSTLINFCIKLEELAGANKEYLKRIYHARKTGQELIQDFFGTKKSNIYWKGRPDLLLEVVNKETGELAKLIIGEVKYTSSKGYARQGFEELIDYLALVKGDDGYKNCPDLSNDKIKGILCLDNIKIESQSIDNLSVVTIDNYQEVLDEIII